MKQKIRGWLKRYLPAEILSIIATLLCAWLANHLTGNRITVALAGTWGGNIAYFGYILISDIVQSVQECRFQGVSYSGGKFLTNIRALLLEFGVAEIIDSMFIRPALMYYLPIWLDSLTIGIMVAKVAADVTFYIPAIASYELNKRHLQKTSNRV